MYYSISRRVARIRFLSLSPQTDIAVNLIENKQKKIFQALKVYRILGYLTLAQTAFSILMFLAAVFEEERKQAKQKAQGKKQESSESTQANVSWVLEIQRRSHRYLG